MFRNRSCFSLHRAGVRDGESNERRKFRTGTCVKRGFQAIELLSLVALVIDPPRFNLASVLDTVGQDSPISLTVLLPL